MQVVGAVLWVVVVVVCDRYVCVGGSTRDGECCVWAWSLNATCTWGRSGCEDDCHGIREEIGGGRSLLHGRWCPARSACPRS
jgi:hypothetical protein